MLVSMAALIYGCIHRMKTGKKKTIWLAGSMVFSYLFTVFVNGIRIVSAIYLPLRLEGVLAGGGWLTAQRLHTLIGIVVYFMALLLVYQAADFMAGIVAGEVRRQRRRIKWAVPVFWYFAIVLGIPFLNGARGKNQGRIWGICGACNNCDCGNNSASLVSFSGQERKNRMWKR